MMRSNCQMPGPRPEPVEAGADIAQAVVNWGLSSGGSERSAVAAAWMPHEKLGKGRPDLPQIGEHRATCSMRVRAGCDDRERR